MKVSISFLLLFLQFQLFAQVVNVGGPVSKSLDINSKSLQYTILPSFDLQQRLIEDDLIHFEKSGPFRFGYEHIVHHDLINSGEWLDVKTGRIWRMSFESIGAYSMNIVFSNYNLPKGAHLHVYDANMKHIIGAYTSHNNNLNNSLGTDLVKGDRITIELYEPYYALGKTVLEVSKVVHGYRDINNWYNLKVNESGACNMDVICPDGVPWSDEIRSVARIVVGGGLCTGTLVNNTSQDGTPYFLTANHCGPTSMGSAVFKFNFDSPTCGSQTVANSQNPTGPNQSINGSSFKASNAASDFGLIELNSVPPASYNVYYSGWNHSNSVPQTGVSIHHPSGDVKKISFDDDPLQTTTYSGTSNNMWQIESWERLTTTEGGSSGSGLWDENHYLIGQLYGGSAACGNSGSDVYGKFSMSWTGNGSSSSNSRLKDWLDPNNSGVSQLAGLGSNAPTLSNDAGILSLDYPSGAYCTSWVPVEFKIKNNGINTLTEIDYDIYIDGAMYTSSGYPFKWTGNLSSGSSVIEALSSSLNIADGVHSIEIKISNVNGQVDPNNSNNNFSSDFSTYANTSLVQLSLDFDCWGSEISWDIKDDQTGAVLWSQPQGTYQDVSPNGYSIIENICLADGCYEFNITDSYGDGMSGAQYNSCDNNGDYNISNQWGTVNFVNMVANNADFGSGTSHDFCLTNTSINNSEIFSAFLYPNPANESLNISLINSSKPNCELIIYDINGQKVLNTIINPSSQNNINIKELNSGYYIVKLVEGQSLTWLRFIKK
ncbi:MAG: lysyl endopeptidase [Crocinitomicaceae bacterium]|nr:lysyl endopeptidase [Crocinitomicaceae bacterium]